MKKIIASMLTFAMIFAFIPYYGGSGEAYAASASTAVGVNVAYHTQEEISNYIHNVGKANLDDPVTFSSQPVTTAPYGLGSLSVETLDSAINMLNQIRYIAGISYDVTLSDEYNEMAQAAALANYVNDELTHYPQQPDGMDGDMYMLAEKGAGSSNIAWSSMGGYPLNRTQVTGWMHDGDTSNIDRVGHRRWMLNPTMRQTGFGAVSGENGTYSAIYAFDRSNSDAAETGVIWPAQNMPIEYFTPAFPWSISMGQTLTADQISVTLTRRNDGKTWNFSSASSADGYFNVDNGGYGQKGCIIFRPNREDIGDYNDGDIFDVTITGASDEIVSYTVNFFDHHNYEEFITKASFDVSGAIETKCKDCGELTERITIPAIGNVTLSETEFTYNGETQIPDIKITNKAGEDIDESNYTVTYPESSIDAGEYTIKIVFQEQYEGEISKTYRINEVKEDAGDSGSDADSGNTDANTGSGSSGSNAGSENSGSNTGSENSGSDTGSGSNSSNTGSTDQESPSDTWAPVGTKIKTGTGNFKVNGEGTAAFTAPAKKTATKITIPASIKIDGKTYPVTEITKNAFKGNKKIKTVVIGKNVKKIRQSAFYGCKNLKNVDIRSSKLSSVGKNAFIKIHKKAIFKVPKSKMKSYKKLLKGKIPSKAIVKKR